MDENKNLYQAYLLEEYPEVKSIEFPKEINIAFSVCSKQCKCYQYTVDDSTQICDYCYRIMLKKAVKRYVISDD